MIYENIAAMMPWLSVGYPKRLLPVIFVHERFFNWSITVNDNIYDRK
jgi:hypothetical protein